MLLQTKRIKNLLVESGFKYDEISVRSPQNSKGGWDHPKVRIKCFNIARNLGVKWSSEEGEKAIIEYVRARIKPLLNAGYPVLECQNCYYVVFDRYSREAILRRELGYVKKKIVDEYVDWMEFEEVKVSS